MPPSITAIIPARIGSTRLPRKALLAETGTPLVVHVCEAAARSARVQRVVVACDDERIEAAVESAGFRGLLTRRDHENGTSRVGEAAALLDLEPESIVVNVQGDEPEIESGAIDAAVDALVRTGASVATIGSAFGSGEDPSDPNIVKVVRGADGRALYFSRALVPHARSGSYAPGAGPLKHIGLYVYRRRFLESYAAMAPTPLEQTERLEQLRILEHGQAIMVAIRDAHHHGIDTPEQYAEFVARWGASSRSADQDRSSGGTCMDV